MDDGVPALSAWHGMTGLAGELVGANEVGKVAEGYTADLLVTNADVVANPQAFEEGALVEVIKSGLAYRGELTKFPKRTFEGCVVDTMGSIS